MEKLKPKLRFPEFNDDWEEKKLGELFNIYAGGDISSNNVSKFKTEKYCYPIYSNGDKNNGIYGYSDIFKQNGNCITVTGRGNLGIAIARYEKFYPIVRLLVLRPKSLYNIKYFEEVINNINFIIESTGVPQLTVPQISNYKVNYTPIQEQEKIASFLSSLDDKINQVNKQLESTKQFKKGLLQYLLNSSKNMKKVKLKLKEIGTFYNSVDKINKLSKNKPDKYVQYLQVSKGGKIKIDELGIAEIPKKGLPVQKGDILFNTSSSVACQVATASVVLDEVENTYLDLFCLGYRINDHNTLLPEYAQYLFSSNEIRKKIVGLAQKSGLYNICKRDLMELEINIPDVAEQRHVVNKLSIVEVVNNKIDLINYKIEYTGQYKKGLLQKMFT